MELHNSFGRQLQRAAIVSRDSIDCGMPFRGRHAQRRGSELHMIKLGRELDQRTIAALSDVGDYLRDSAVDAGGVAAAAP